MIGDAASATTLVLSTSTRSSAVGAIGFGGYLFASPTIHLVRGHLGKAALSFALRATLPLAGYGLGAAAAGGHPAYTPGVLGFDDSANVPATATFGLVLGALAATIVDDAWIAREDAHVKREAAKPSWSPTIAPSTRGAMLGIGGTF